MRLRYNGLATGAAGSTVPLALGASLTSGATSVTFNAALTYNNGTAVPTIVSGDVIPLVILDTNGHVSEIVWLTAYTAGATTGTIARGQEGTSGVSHSSGDKVACSLLVRDLSQYELDPVTLNPTYGDHFEAAALDAKWNRQGYTSAGENFRVGPLQAYPGKSNSFFRQDTSKGSNNYYWQTAPAGDFTVAMRCAMFASPSAMFGPLILDSSGNGVQACVYTGPDAEWVMTCSAGAYSGTNQNVSAGLIAAYAWGGGEMWYQLNKTGTAYKARVSRNGQDWLPWTATVTFGTTPTRIGFGNILGTVPSFAIDWFDVQ